MLGGPSITSSRLRRWIPARLSVCCLSSLRCSCRIKSRVRSGGVDGVVGSRIIWIGMRVCRRLRMVLLGRRLGSRPEGGCGGWAAGWLVGWGGMGG